MPESTSSKIKVGIWLASEVITLIARLMRANSPPDATFDNGFGETPG